MVNSSEQFLKRDRRSRPDVTRDKVSPSGISRRFLTWTFTPADHAGTSCVYSMEQCWGLGTGQPGMVAFYITYESLLGAEVQTGREGHEAQLPSLLHCR
jgi:hypothetical protein